MQALLRKAPESGAATTTALDSRLEATSSLGAMLARQRKAFQGEPFPACATRLSRLRDLDRAIRSRYEDIKRAANADFGSRSEDETLVAEIMGTLKGITYARRHLKRWMKPRRRAVDFTFKPATAKLLPQPLGVVGIISPWNFPFGLTIKPLIAAVAAGNRVMIKPSEHTPAMSDLLADLLGHVFDETEVYVARGDATLGRAFCKLPFDHLLFTGGTEVGRAVAAASAPNLTPLTLELGGKCPVIVDDRISMERVVKSVITGKLLNAGQTCTAPDYVLVPEKRLKEFKEHFCTAARRMYPDPVGSADYTSIINEHHFRRLQGYLEDAAAMGSETVHVYPELRSSLHSRKQLPALIIEPPSTARIMQEEIFGPLLVVWTYRSLDEAIDFVNFRPRPLALYLFSDDRRIEDKVLTRTHCGGVTVNDTLLHYTQESLPFGGIGASGFGAYHGHRGFETFSHLKPVFRQSRLNGLDLLRAPYDRTSRLIVNAILRFS